MAYESNDTQELKQAASNVKNAAKLARDVGRIAAGDATAVKDLLTNKLVGEIVLAFVLFISIGGLLLGASITGVINYISSSWEQNWEENWTDQAIISNGNIEYLKTMGWLHTVEDTMKDVLSDVFSALAGNGLAEGAGSKDNAQIQDGNIQDAGRNPEASDYETTLQAIMDNAALNKALMDRIEMIQGRVKQRGMQIAAAINTQYMSGRKSALTEIAEQIAESMDSDSEELGNGTVILYAGYNEDLSNENVHFDDSAFQLTDLQALKILALFSIQHDCQLSEIDIWSLMDYCGWYNMSADPGDLDDIPDTIYETITPTQTFGDNLGGIYTKGQPIPLASVEFPALHVPIWTGSCAPQWYYEELAQIRKHNNAYLDALRRGETPDGVLWGINAPISLDNSYTIPAEQVVRSYVETTVTGTTYYTTDYVLYNTSGKKIKTITSPYTNQDITFKELERGTTYTIKQISYQQTFDTHGFYSIRIQVGEPANIASFYVPVTPNSAETDALDLSSFEKLSQVQPFGIIDKLYYSAENNITINKKEYDSADGWTREQIEDISSKIAKYWDKHVWAETFTNLLGNIIGRDNNGIHYYTYLGELPEDSTAIVNKSSGRLITYTTYALRLYDAEGVLVAEMGHPDPVLSPEEGAEETLAGFTFTDLLAESRYTLYQVKYNTHDKFDKNGIKISSTSSEKESFLDSFKTYEDREKIKVYEMYISVNLSFKARSIDELAFELLGFWPGKLQDTVQVVQKTNQDNEIGKTTLGEKKYYFSLEGGTLNLVKPDGSVSPGRQYQKLLRARSNATYEENSLTTTRFIYEYGLSTYPLSNPANVPDSGWRTVTRDGANLVFEVSPQSQYYAYARITIITDTVGENGNKTSTKTTSLYLIDEVRPGTTEGSFTANQAVTNGAIYAKDHLGNETLLHTWSDTFIREVDEGDKIFAERVFLQFDRMTGFQYESYVDMVLALCKYLQIPYDDWDAAVQRAEELGIHTTPRT